MIINKLIRNSKENAQNFEFIEIKLKLKTFDDQISQGIEDKRIEALLAQKIHAIT